VRSNPGERRHPSICGTATIVARKARALSGLTPGALIKRRRMGSSRTMSRTCLVNLANSPSITPYISSSGSFMGAKTSSPPILCLAPRRRRELPAGFAQDGPPQFFDRPHLVEPCRGGAIPPAAPTVPISTRSILRRAQEVLAKLEHFLRKAAERTAAATGRRIGTLLDDFSPAECANYLANSGYASV
jgi:hypothetical protein